MSLCQMLPIDPTPAIMETGLWPSWMVVNCISATISIGVFDDHTPGGPVDILEVRGQLIGIRA
jgi:hypothetical protein